MKKIKGDLIKLAKDGEFDVIVHGCNCMNTMGAGIARQIRDEFPEVYERDKQTEAGDKDKLGKIDIVKLDSLIVVNAYTQYDYTGRTRGERDVNYGAIGHCFSYINFILGGKGLRFGIPMIGAGLAGGDWQIIEEIVGTIMRNEDLTLVEYQK